MSEPTSYKVTLEPYHNGGSLKWEAIIRGPEVSGPCGPERPILNARDGFTDQAEAEGWGRDWVHEYKRGLKRPQTVVRYY